MVSFRQESEVYRDEYAILGKFPARLEIKISIAGFNRNIRGKRLEVRLLKRLRDEMQFSDVLKLKRQIKKDVDHVR